MSSIDRSGCKTGVADRISDAASCLHPTLLPSSSGKYVISAEYAKAKSLTITHSLQGPHFVAQVMEILHTMQREQPNMFSGARFKVEPKAERAQEKIQCFRSFIGPDELTRELLETDLHDWDADPHAFWRNPRAPLWGTSPTVNWSRST